MKSVAVDNQGDVFHPSLKKKKGLDIFSVKSTWQSGDDITTLKF
jgi:hypothetical protein